MKVIKEFLRLMWITVADMIETTLAAIFIIIFLLFAYWPRKFVINIQCNSCNYNLENLKQNCFKIDRILIRAQNWFDKVISYLLDEKEGFEELVCSKSYNSLGSDKS